jgi:ATP-dependent RNA helicase DHX8/PRP22
MLTAAENFFCRPRDQQAVANQKHTNFFAPEGDQITLLTVFQGWADSDFSDHWARDNFIQVRALRRALDIRKQLESMMNLRNIDLVSCGKDFTRVSKVCADVFIG